MDIDKKKNIIRVVKNIWFVIASILAVCFIVLMGVSCANMNKNKNSKNNSNVNTSVEVVNKVQPKLVSYDDSNYQITLNVNEVTNYHFDNLKSYLVTNSITSQVSILYDSVTYSIDENNANYISYYARIDTEPYFICLGIFGSNTTEPYSFGYYSGGSHGERIDFTDGIVLVIDSTIYDDIQNAIELDISSNNPPSIIGNGGIFENISNSVVGFVGSLSSGITAMVGIFYNNGALTVLGLLSVIVVAISLAYFFFRLIMGLIRMRG